MSKIVSPKGNKANQQNPNKGTSGASNQYDYVQGYKGSFLKMNFLKLLIAISISIIFVRPSDGQVLLGEHLYGMNIQDRFGLSVTISHNGSRIVVGSPGLSTDDNQNGYVNVYDNVNEKWELSGQTIVSPAEDARFGSSVAISKSGNRIAIGGIFGGAGGLVSIYDFNNNSWEKVGNTIIGETANSNFGSSIAMSEDGNIVAVGASFDFGSFQNSGSVKVFNLIGNNWSQIGADINGETPSEGSGSAIAMSGDGKILCVGAPNYNVTGTSSGIVRTYVLQDNQWIKLDTDINGQVEDRVGRSIALSAHGLKLAVGAPHSLFIDGGNGYVQVYEMMNNAWIKLGQAINGKQLGDNFGSSVSLNAIGDQLAIGARRSDESGEDAGKIDFYALKNNDWSQVGLSILGDYDAEGVGSALSISGDGNKIIISRQFNDEVGMNAGKVSIYSLTNLTSIEEDSYLKQIVAFPNPVQNLLTIKQLEGYDFDLLDCQGNMLKHLISNESQINFEDLARGIYFIKCKTSSKIKTIKVVKI